jgi:hypothetical protein
MAACTHDQEIGIELGHLDKYGVGNSQSVEIVLDDLCSGMQPMPP